MAYKTILYDVSDGVATITINRPEVLNAMNHEQQDDIIAALDAADADDNVRAIIVTGAGRAFCAGADFSKGASIFDKGKAGAPTAMREDGSFDYSNPASRDGGGYLGLRLYNSLKPVIGAVNGAAVGVGASMILPMDVRIAADTAKLGFVYARRGIVHECCSSWFLPRVVGIAKAMEWSLSGRVMPAQELKEGGLFSEVVPADQLLPRAREIAKEIADNTAPVSITLMRHMLWRSLGMDHPMEAHKIESRGICTRGRSADAKEGVQSFLEKRPPAFPGKVSADLPDFFPWWVEPEYS